MRPVSLAILFTMLGRFSGDPEAAQSYLVRLVAYSIPLILVGGIPQAFYREKMGNTLPFLAVSSGNHFLAFWARAILYIPVALIGLMVSLASAWLILNMDLSSISWSTLAVSSFLITLSSITFAMVIGAVTLVFTDVNTTRTIGHGLILGLTGIVIPLESLPAALSTVGTILPLTHGLDGFSASFTGGSLQEHSSALLTELAVALAFACLAWLLFEFVIALGRRDGTMVRNQ
jgi:ABC-2 type transport system permease protein